MITFSTFLVSAIFSPPGVYYFTFYSTPLLELNQLIYLAGGEVDAARPMGGSRSEWAMPPRSIGRPSSSQWWTVWRSWKKAKMPGGIRIHKGKRGRGQER